MKKLIINRNSIVVALAISFALVLSGLVMAATTVNLGAADNFAVLADTAISDDAPTGAITGDVGLGPTSGGASITGLTGAQVSGTIYAMNAAGPDGVAGDNPALVGAAKTALTAAYLDAEAQTLPSVTTVTESTTNSFNITGTTLAPGIYKSPSSMGITGTLTLSGSATDVWIFQAGSTLTTAAATEIVLTGGAQACNVFWQVGSSATLGTGTLFKGNILALTSITDNGGSVVQGRLLARNGAVSLNNTTVVKATCVAPPPAPPAPSSAAAGGPGFSVLPLINVTKIPSPLALPGGAGFVTYTYTATNIGKVAMSNVWVKDNKCNSSGFVEFVSGDSNNDSKLDINESWIYRCTKIVSETETNTATARGFYNGWDTYDTANATVVVGTSLTPPLIHLVKKPSVFVLPAGGGAVTYSYAVTNPGTVPLNNVSIVDDKCTGLPGRVVGHPGDLNKNNLLESNETWQFTCQTNLTRTTTNIGTAEGKIVGFEGWSMHVRLDEETLRGIADITRGEYFYAGSAPDLKKIYETLNSRFVLEKKRTEITALFAAAATVLVIAAALLSLLWFNRIL